MGIVVRRSDGTSRSIAADTVVTALPLVPNAAVSAEFAGCAPHVRDVGDAHEPGLIRHAIAARARVGREIQRPDACRCVVGSARRAGGPE